MEYNKKESLYIWVCFRSDLNIKDFPLTIYLENFLMNDSEILNDLYVDRKDIYMNDKIDNIYINKSIRLGIVNKGG